MYYFHSLKPLRTNFVHWPVPELCMVSLRTDTQPTHSASIKHPAPHVHRHCWISQDFGGENSLFSSCCNKSNSSWRDRWPVLIRRSLDLNVWILNSGVCAAVVILLRSADGAKFMPQKEKRLNLHKYVVDSCRAAMNFSRPGLFVLSYPAWLDLWERCSLRIALWIFSPCSHLFCLLL